MNLDGKIEVIHKDENIQAVYDKVFTARDGDEIYFTPMIEKKGIITPIQYTIDKEYVAPFLAAVHSVGEEEFYISTTERVKGVANDWLVPLSAVSLDWGLDNLVEQVQYFQLVENAIYSVNGKWGMWFSDGDIALIGGPTNFIDTFYRALGKTIDEMVFKFLHDTRDFQPKARKIIIEERIPNLFGKEEATRYMEMYKANYG
jgi:hypothetical protein